MNLVPEKPPHSEWIDSLRLNERAEEAKESILDVVNDVENPIVALYMPRDCTQATILAEVVEQQVAIPHRRPSTRSA